MPLSLHSHSGQFCRHARGQLEEVVQKAISKGFSLYGFSEHASRYRISDLYPEESDVTPAELEETFRGYLVEAKRLKEAYKDQITLLIGAETEYITDLDLSNLESILAQHPEIEYLIGSVHHANEIPIDFDESTFRRALESFRSDNSDTDDVLIDRLHESYLDAQYRLITRLQPEVIGHFDLCRLYTPARPFSPSSWARAERNVLAAIGHGALFELNAAAFRKGWDSPYPGRDVLRLILDNGGRLTVSDDSHGPHAVGLNYARLYDYLQEMGVKELWTLETSDTPNIAGRRTRPVILLSEAWQNHRLWKDSKS